MPRLGGQLAAVQRPGQVGQAKTTVAHRARHAKTGRSHFVGGQKLFYDLFQAGVFLGRILLISVLLQFSIGKIKQRQIDLGAAYVARQNHRSLSKTPQPSPSVAGRRAAAALSRNQCKYTACGPDQLAGQPLRIVRSG